jgi:hypothetical protein
MPKQLNKDRQKGILELIIHTESLETSSSHNTYKSVSKAPNLGGASGVDVKVDGLLGILILGQHDLRDQWHEAHP